MKKSNSKNQVLIELIKELNKKSAESGLKVWRAIARSLSQKRACVNLSRISRCTKKNDVVAVPGKVLSSGLAAHPLTVAAFNFSEKAREKIAAAGGKCISIRELMSMKLKGAIKIVK